MGVEGGGRDGSASRQIEVELAAALLAGAQTSRPGVVARLQELREAWREHSRQEEARGARQGQLLREVDRVDREAARLALETARLRRLKEEAMEVVRRVEPGLLEELVYRAAMLPRLVDNYAAVDLAHGSLLLARLLQGRLLQVRLLQGRLL